MDLYRGHKGRPRGSRYLLAVPGMVLLLTACLLACSSSGGQTVYARPATDAPTATPTSTPDCSVSWRVVSSPNPSSTTNYLLGMAAVSPNDVWTVGSYNVGNGTYWTLTIHWNGTQWTQVQSPNPGNQSVNSLLGVEAVSSDDVWAVGYTNPYGGPWLTLIEHWNGTQWSVVSSPNVGVSTNYLYGVSEISANDVWAVGYYINNQGYYNTLIEHWNGTQWSVVPSPNGSYSSSLNSVSALASNDVWAVGSCCGQANGLTLVEHWDGSQWSIVPSPNPSSAYRAYLNGVSAISANDVWAVGVYSTNNPAFDGTLMEHWDGSQWSIMPSPNIGSINNILNAVSAASTNDVWASGYSCCGSTASTLIEHWDGNQWSIVPSPNVSGNSNYLPAIATIAPNDVWAVGHYFIGNPDWTLIEHFSSPCSTPTPSATLIATPSATNTVTPKPTSTPTQSRTPTQTATPTPNSGQQIIGHITWQSIPQPNPRNIGLTATLSICVGGVPSNNTVSTDASGYFTLDTTLPNGTYNWRLKGSRWLATNGTLTLSGGTTNVEMGMQRAGDADGNNGVNTTDFTILKSGFGGSADRRADFDNDGAVTVADFTLLRSNFGSPGAPANCP